MADITDPCPSCGATGLTGFHSQRGVPANSCLLLDTRDEAVNFGTGDIDLGICPRCGFITNVRFDQRLAEYSERYEETQAFSDRFVAFAQGLATRWVDEYELAGRTVLEVGCGKGEFLVMMAEAGIGHGIGFDPGIHPDRIVSSAGKQIEWVKDFYDLSHAHIQADAIVCRHTLEHIGAVAEFMEMIRTNIGDRLDTVVLFELPDVQRVLDEVAFWDVYYEHCSYFSKGSLARLFERTGFEVIDLWSGFDDQYMLIEARPVVAGTAGRTWPADDMDALVIGADHFRAGFSTTIDEWDRKLSDLQVRSGTAVIWGAGSKGVSFLSSVGGAIAAAVDINPHKHGMFMAGSGHEIVAPEELTRLQPDLVIAMNPIYLDEIRSDLTRLGLHPELEAV